jgi:hypothetical protein
MSTQGNSGPSRGPRSTHLRQVSTTSSTSLTPIQSQQSSRPASSGQSSVATAHVRHVERLCTLWCHDSDFSKDEVVLNTNLFPPGTVKPGDLAEICVLRTRPVSGDFKDSSQNSTPASNARGKSDQVGTPPRKHSGTNGQGAEDGEVLDDASQDIDPEKCYVFVVKEQEAKQANLQISLSNVIAREFGFQNRTQVLVRTVSQSRLTIIDLSLFY